MRIATYNVENLFERALALSADADEAGARAIIAQGEINVLLRKATYTDADRRRIIELLAELGLRDDDGGGEFALLRQNRGDLLRRPNEGPVEVVARGRADWVGWVELKRGPVDEVSTRNTARVLHEVAADILGLAEAESRTSLRDFSRVMLRRVGGEPYAHSMLIEGNDDRGIDVGLLTREGFEIELARTHIFDLAPNDRPIFSRDCAEYLVRTPGGSELLVLVNHFKSKRGGGDERRLAQARRVREIVEERLRAHPLLAVVGDLNDTPDSDSLRPLLKEAPLKDVSASDRFDDGGFPGTFGTQGARNKIDYILLSEDLFESVTAAGVFRRGVYSASERWPTFDTITDKEHQASDHAAVWVDLEVE